MDAGARDIHVVLNVRLQYSRRSLFSINACAAGCTVQHAANSMSSSAVLYATFTMLETSVAVVGTVYADHIFDVSSKATPLTVRPT